MPTNDQLLLMTTWRRRRLGGKRNLMRFSQAIDSVAYTNVGTPTVVADNALAPDGTMTADTITDADAAGICGRRQTITIPNDGTRYCASIFVPKSSAGFPLLNLRINGGTVAVDGYVAIDPTSGAVTGSPGTTVGVENAGNFWRFWVSVANNNTGNVNLLASFYPCYTSTFSASTPDAAATGSCVFWGLQVEAASSPSGYSATLS